MNSKKKHNVIIFGLERLTSKKEYIYCVVCEVVVVYITQEGDILKTNYILSIQFQL